MTTVNKAAEAAIEKKKCIDAILTRLTPGAGGAHEKPLARLPLPTLQALSAALQTPAPAVQPVSTFPPYVTTQPQHPPADPCMNKIAALLNDEERGLMRENPIRAIQSLRLRLNLSLRTAKDVVDVARGLILSPTFDSTIPELEGLRIFGDKPLALDVAPEKIKALVSDDERRFLLSGLALAAIKNLRERTRLTLRASKEIIDLYANRAMSVTPATLIELRILGMIQD